MPATNYGIQRLVSYADYEGGESDNMVLFCHEDPALAIFTGTLGNKDEPRGMEGKGQVLANSNVIQLGLGSLDNQERGWDNAARVLLGLRNPT